MKIFYHDDYQLESKIFSIPEDELETETTESIDENKEIVENIDLETLFVNFDMAKGEKWQDHHVQLVMILAQV